MSSSNSVTTISRKQNMSSEVSDIGLFQEEKTDEPRSSGDYHSNDENDLETNHNREAAFAVERSTWTQRERVQSIANFISHGLALFTLLAVFRWISMLGGLSWQEGQAKRVFNWHPLLMITAFCFMTVASLSFRFPLRSSSRTQTKFLHGVSWLVAALCAWMALIAVFKSHNDSTSGYIANMYSLHSWIGALVIIAYVLQFSLGAYSFWWSKNEALKALVLQFHVVVGPLLYFMVSANILLGIQEKEGFVGCSYRVQDGPDHFPYRVREIPSTCIASHFLGLLVFLTSASTFVALHSSSSVTTGAARVMHGGTRAD